MRSRFVLGLAAVLAAGAGGMLARAGLADGGGGSGGAATAADAVARASLPLGQVAERVRGCGADGGGECVAAVYVWSPRMPLSVDGYEAARQAAARVGAPLLVLEAEALEGLPEANAGRAAADDPFARELRAAGATLHYPALLPFVGGRPAGGAILGYKTVEAWETLLRERIAAPRDRPALAAGAAPADSLSLSIDFPARGRPGAYFRSVAGRQTLAYEAEGTVHLLDLRDGSTGVAPGFIDFVPSPDGQIFVTPASRNRGLEFYDAREVFAAAERGSGRQVQPIHLDPELRDQYPSVGILRHETTGRERVTVYRVLTSWFAGVAFRDFEVRSAGDGPPTVRPIGARTAACTRVSIPILSPDGREVAGRDEESGTTRIFSIDEDGECVPAADTGLPTGKVAWAPDGRTIAFAVPRGAVRDGGGVVRGEPAPEMSGIFVFRRDGSVLSRLPGSEAAQRLAFPDFVGPDSLVYQVAPAGGAGTVFRLVCCVD